MSDNEVTLAFVCVQNAGRSQMATAYAQRELENRNLGHRVEVVTGGTNPADSVHEGVVEVMQEDGIDLSDRTPREITFDELQEADIVITMGCSAEDVCPATWSGESRDWDLDDPHGQPLDAIHATRDEIRDRVADLFAELEADRSVEPR
jgi:protein-tyrosine-phosphatase